VQPDTTGNEAMYGKHSNDQDILSGQGVTMPPAAQPLIKQLDTHPTTSPGAKG
jgi:lipid-binding SYLF domain-containing protein